MYPESSHRLPSSIKKELRASFEKQKIFNQHSRSKRFEPVEPYKPARLPLRMQVCVIQLVIDYTFYKDFAFSNREVAIGEAFAAFYKANEIFERTDFDMDGYSDFIGIRPGIVLVDSERASPLKPTYQHIRSLIQDCSLVPQVPPHCLSYCFVSMDFKHYFGATITADKQANAGICTREAVHAIPGKNDTFVTLYENIGAVSMLANGKRLSRLFFTGVFAHEVGHGFGANHDFNSCSTRSSTG